MSILSNYVRLTIDFDNEDIVRGSILENQGQKIGLLKHTGGIKSSIHIFINNGFFASVRMKKISGFVLVEIMDGRGTLIGKAKICEKIQSVLSIERPDNSSLCRAKLISPNGTVKIVNANDDSRILAVVSQDLVNEGRSSTRVQFVQSSNKELLLSIAVLIIWLNKRAI